MKAPGTLNTKQCFTIISVAVGVLWLLLLFVAIKNLNETSRTLPQQRISKEKSPPQRTVTEEEKTVSVPSPSRSADQQTVTGEDKTPSKQTVAPGTSGPDALYLGNTYLAAKAYDQAIQQYDYAIDHGAPAYYVRGVAWLEKQNYERAIADFTQAIQREAGYYLTYFHRADAYAHKGDRDSAIADYRRALALKPDETVKKQIIVGLERLGVEPESQKDDGAHVTRQRARTKHRTGPR